MEFANGVEKDGIKYIVYFQSPDYVVEVRHPNGMKKTETFHCIHEPVFGPDMDDVSRGEYILQKLIDELRREANV